VHEDEGLASTAHAAVFVTSRLRRTLYQHDLKTLLVILRAGIIRNPQ